MFVSNVTKPVLWIHSVALFAASAHSLYYVLPRMYADDTNISMQSNNLSELENLMNAEIANLNTWLEANKLSLNIAKTGFMIIGSRQRLSNFDNQNVEVCVNNKQINRVLKSKSLLTIDENLT